LATLTESRELEGIWIGPCPLPRGDLYVSIIKANCDRIHELAKDIEQEIEGWANLQQGWSLSTHSSESQPCQFYSVCQH
ncbi:hypothetical protein V8E55_002656, partial [Tylopilus felleus]